MSRKEEVALVGKKSYVWPYCQKEFTNGKVYGGHKRSHTVKNKNKGQFHMAEKIDEHVDSDDEGEGFVLDLSKALPGWSRTGKRGRKGGKGTPRRLPPIVDDYDNGTNDSEYPELPTQRQRTMSSDGASNLLALADAEPGKPRLPPKKRRLDFPTIQDAKIQHKEIRKHLKFVVSDEEDDNTMNTPITSEKYVCSICDRSFRSYQALGGHKAHHNRKYELEASSIDDEISSSSDQSVGLLQYQCPFCSKIFFRGQALGGHKRHCKARAQKAALRRILAFDLNKPPPAETRGVGDGQETISLPWHEDGAEHDSSSSNCSPSG